MKLRSFFVGTAAAAALLASAQTLAYDDFGYGLERPSAEAMTFDLFVVRPLTLAGAVVGTAVFAVALPINLITGNLVDPAHALVLDPLKYAFTRDLGDLR